MNKTQNRETGEDKRLTVEKFRKHPGTENYTDEEAGKAVQSLRQLSEILVLIPEIRNYLIDNQSVVYLNSESSKAA